MLDEGRENVPVRQGEVVEEATNDKKKGHWNWSFRFKEDQDERAGSIAFALWVILCGGLLLAGNLLQLDYDFWDILWPSGLIFVGLSSLFKNFSFFGMGCLFFGGLFQHTFQNRLISFLKHCFCKIKSE